MNNQKFCSLRKKEDISFLFDKGCRVDNSIYTIKYKKSKIGKFQFLIALNKKTFRTAVIRNKIRRQIRSYVQKMENYHKINCVIIVKKNYLTNEYKNNYKEFQTLLKKIKYE